MKRKIMIGVVVIGMLVGSAYMAAAAGGPGLPGRGDRAGMHLDRMAKVLGLSDTQKEQIGAILKAEWDKTEPLRQQLFENRKQIMESTFSGKFDEAAVRAMAEKQAGIETELIVSHAKAKSQIHALLTPEQLSLAEKLGPMMGRRHGHMQPSDDSKE